MAALFVLVISLLLLRGLGLLGVRRLSSWREAGLIAVVIMFLFTGSTHFSAMKHDYAAMLPSPLSGNLGIIYLTEYSRSRVRSAYSFPELGGLRASAWCSTWSRSSPVTCTPRSTRSRFVGSHPPRCGCGRRYSSSSSGWSCGPRSGSRSSGSKRRALRSPLQREPFRRSVSRAGAPSQGPPAPLRAPKELVEEAAYSEAGRVSGAEAGTLRARPRHGAQPAAVGRVLRPRRSPTASTKSPTANTTPAT